MFKVNAVARLKVTAAEDPDKKQRAKKLADLIVRSLKAAGAAAVVNENRLLNRNLTGPSGGSYFSVTTDAPFEDVAEMMADAGWTRDASRLRWTQRGHPTLSIRSAGAHTIIYIY